MGSIDGEELRRRSDSLIFEQARTVEGIILRRAAVAVLHDDAPVLRVRLDGPPDGASSRRCECSACWPEAAARAVRKLELTHDAYLRQFYGADIRDPALYHLILDSTVLLVETCVEVIVLAARSYQTVLERQPPGRDHGPGRTRPLHRRE